MPRVNANTDLDCPIRDVLDRMGDAWSLLVMLELSRGPCRFNALRRVVDGISQRMLSVTLRHLERDGLVNRRVLPLTPPQVEYSLTTLGFSLIERVEIMRQWAVENQTAVRAARQAYDRRREAVAADT
ncbi:MULTISPECIES: winged helix-turn-helix transcriptional regulator [Actibacterium]|uniref:DNA-binding HxlR family transcriptional regulator n=1 Tax=Actibacterium naphthalenivorans TaxID=1614693 RepID=A0A840C7E6_9RHOB|nr:MULTISPECIES: helix-turn-helix domain-containing protein [Actibacterium]ALG91527.1 HxlR family transcriptional regulator [Actibacterium sp. EMB200-NS6]MBB4021864.1 DNA-binding HxlR family transcriptional regulator [Actibacterium naphthalenivorans]